MSIKRIKPPASRSFVLQKIKYAVVKLCTRSKEELCPVRRSWELAAEVSFHGYEQRSALTASS